MVACGFKEGKMSQSLLNEVFFPTTGIEVKEDAGRFKVAIPSK